MENEIILEEELQLYIPEVAEVCVKTTKLKPSKRKTETIDLECKKGRFECEECGIVLSQQSTMDMHKEQVHVDQVFYACEFCSETRIPWFEYYVHQCTNVDNKPLACPQCHKTVSTKKQLQQHEEVHALQRRFTTKKLDSYFARKLEEAEDPTVDWGAKAFLCGVCGKPFGKLYEVEYHEKLHSEERPPPHACVKCGLLYINKNDLNKHIARGCFSELARKTKPPRQ